jgi:hypothetical protein
LKKENPAAYEQYKSDTPSKFQPLIFDDAIGLDGKKLGDIQKKITNAGAEAASVTPEEKAVADASISGDRKTLKADAAIPATMAVIYLGLLVYFASIGGYKPVHIETESQLE